MAPATQAKAGIACIPATEHAKLAAAVAQRMGGRLPVLEMDGEAGPSLR